MDPLSTRIANVLRVLNLVISVPAPFTLAGFLRLPGAVSTLGCASILPQKYSIGDWDISRSDCLAEYRQEVADRRAALKARIKEELQNEVLGHGTAATHSKSSMSTPAI